MRLPICKQAAIGHPFETTSPRTSFHRVRIRGKLAILIFLGAVTILLASCGSGKSKYQFKSAQEGIISYEQFLKELKTAKSTDMASIAKDIAAWQELEDSVQAVIRRDTSAAHSPHSLSQEYVRSLHGTAREEFLNRAIAKPRTLQDVVTLRMETNRLSHDMQIDSAVRAAEPLFLSMDSVSIYNMDCSHLLRRYQSYLRHVEKTGIGSRQQFMLFLREEDRLFRSFATHLSEMDGKSATNITKTTERIYAQLSRDASAASISPDDLFIYLTMRTNRRLLVNAQACLADIKASRVKTSDQRQAYLWMLVQPFSSINDLGLALLTSTQKATFAQLAKEASPLLMRLAGTDKAERQRIAALPDLMVKIYISSL